MLLVWISSYRKTNPYSFWFTNRRKWFKQNYCIVWNIHCRNRLFDVSKPHQTGKVLYSGWSLCHVLTININPPGKCWQRLCAAMVKKSNWKSEMCHYWYIIIDLMLNLLIFARSFREGNFSLLFFSLNQVMKCCFACDPIIFIGSWSFYMIWLTYHLHQPTSTNVFLMAVLLFKSQTENKDDESELP